MDDDDNHVNTWVDCVWVFGMIGLAVAIVAVNLTAFIGYLV